LTTLIAIGEFDLENLFKTAENYLRTEKDQVDEGLLGCRVPWVCIALYRRLHEERRKDY
jgi:hypothetical protein